MKGKLVSSVVLLATALLFAMVFVVSGQLSTTQSVTGKAPAAPLSEGISPEQQLAQDLALSDTQVQAYTVGRRSEVMGVGLVGLHYTPAASECATADCRQVTIYNWDENVTITAIVNVDSRSVLDVLHLPASHPGINKRLVDLSQQLVLNDPGVAEVLGFQPTVDDLAFAPMEGDAPGTSCEGIHLCVAYTFDQNDRMLWAWIDLTDEKVAGLRWTSVNPGENELYNNTSVFNEGCPPSGSVNQDGWTMEHDVTGSDGLRVFNIKYNGNDVATSIKLAEWHADYGNTGYRDSTGCGGGGGFPIYPYGNTQVLQITDGFQAPGFEIVQDFRMSSWGNSCNYRYEQRIQFFADGRFRTVSGAYGKGCGTNALYRPLVRIDIAVDGDANDTFALWESGQWVDQTTELYRTPYNSSNGPHEMDSNGYAWRIMDQGGNGFYMEPSQVDTFGDGSRGDDNFIYAVLHKPAEGDSDLSATIGSCCNDDHQQGPHQYVNGESIDNTNIVLWYVPQMDTDATDGGDGYYCWTLQGEPNPVTYPCFTGPMFVPVNAGKPAAASFTHNGPVPLGQSAIFTNGSTGAPPLTYDWDFGDGVGTSTDENPTYDYTASGTYTVSLTTDNAFGSDTYSLPILVSDGPINYFIYQPFVVNQP